MSHKALQLLEYHVWANDRIINHLKALPEETYRSVIQSIFPSIAEALVHIYRIDSRWLHIMSGGTFEQILALDKQVTEATEGISLDGIQALYHEVAEKYRTFYSDKDLDALKEYPHPTYGVMKASYADIIQHLSNHGTYHRGNITAMLRQQGHPGVPTDYAFFLYEI
ncbi:DinB family protein [Paenibacillus sp. NPDC056579]|uniref:DinB family protein n=1 Tax=unclassified Paenibacillus TaxID=185978 RepID=UPI001EF7DD3B|nr:DinB family protein [Paenibacillus sp. H1-7]ULL13501.1 damage-inducible protein DinB [Paenibacillus sp. H1-7]